MEHRARIRETLATLEEVREELVFLGACVLGLYAGETGSPLRATEDVDCFSTVQPWILQAEILGRLCTDGVLDPDAQQAQRYKVRDSGLVIDVISPEGMNVPPSEWLRRAAQHFRVYDLGNGEQVKAVAPPYFLALKLAAFLDRGADFQSSKDIEDIVFVVAEIPGLMDEVESAGIGVEIAALWQRALVKHNLAIADLGDIAEAHLGASERPRRDSIVRTLSKLANG